VTGGSSPEQQGSIWYRVESALITRAFTAALLVVLPLVVLVGSDLVAAKELGLATAAGLVLDLVLLRILLAPGMARLSH
jgi:hypothetical protein